MAKHVANRSLVGSSWSSNSPSTTRSTQQTSSSWCHARGVAMNPKWRHPTSDVINEATCICVHACKRLPHSILMTLSRFMTFCDTYEPTNWKHLCMNFHIYTISVYVLIKTCNEGQTWSLFLIMFERSFDNIYWWNVLKNKCLFFVKFTSSRCIVSFAQEHTSSIYHPSL